MAAKMPSKSSPAETGKEEESIEVCTRRMGVTLCGDPDDVKKVLSLLENLEHEQPEITPSDAAVAATGSEDEIGNNVSPSAHTEDDQPTELESLDDAEDDDCPCQMQEFGGNPRIAEEGEI